MITAADGREALDHLRRGERPRLILLDLMMPRMNGSEFRAEQLRDPQFAAIPVIAISGDGNVAAKAATLGIQGIRKPLAYEQLLAIVRAY